MEMQTKLNEMLRKKLHEEMEDQINDCRVTDETDQLEALHRMFICQEIVAYFDEHNVSSKEAAALLENDYLLADLYDEWCGRYDGKCTALFEAFLESEIAIEVARNFGKGA